MITSEPIVIAEDPRGTGPPTQVQWLPVLVGRATAARYDLSRLPSQKSADASRRRYSAVRG